MPQMPEKCHSKNTIIRQQQLQISLVCNQSENGQIERQTDKQTDTVRQKDRLFFQVRVQVHVLTPLCLTKFAKIFQIRDFTKLSADASVPELLCSQ